MSKHDYSILWRNVDKETDFQECEVIGELPPWLNGKIIFNGCGVMKIGKSEFRHSFDGSGILQKFTIKNGKASYCSKFLQSETYKRNKKAGKIMVAEFGTPGPSSQGVMSRVINAMDSDKMFSDNASLMLIQMGSKYFALGNTPFFLEVDPKTLNVINRVNMNKTCQLLTQSPNILQDKSGIYYSIGMMAGIKGPKYAIVQYPKDGKIEEAKVIATFPSPSRISPPYIHNVAMTDNYLIFIETPLVISLMEVLTGLLSNKPFAEGLLWQEESRCIFRVIERKTWKEVTTKYVTDPFFFLNFGNVYEELGHIVIDISCYKDSSMTNQLFVDKMKEAYKKEHSEIHGGNFECFLRRYVLPLSSGLMTNLENENLITLPNTTCQAFRNDDEIYLTHEVLCDTVPLCGPLRSNSVSTCNKKSNIIFSNFGDTIQPRNYGTMVKLNISTKETILFHEEDLYPSNTIFIPRPGSLEEDDGLLVALCLRSSNKNYVALIVLSAKTMKEVGRAHVNLRTEVTIPTDVIYIPDTN